MKNERVFDYVEGKLSPHDRAKFEQTLSGDAHLRGEVEAARKIATSFSALRNLPVPPDLLADTRRKIEAAKFTSTRSQPEPTNHPLRWFWALGATAAFALIAFLTYKQFSTHTAAPQVAVNDTADQEKEIPVGIVNPLTPVGNAARFAQVEMKEEISRVDDRATQIMQIANAFGGTATREQSATREERVFAYIPQSQVDNFRRRLEGVDASKSSLALDGVTIANPVVLGREREKVEAVSSLAAQAPEISSISKEPSTPSAQAIGAGSSRDEIWKKDMTPAESSPLGLSSGKPDAADTIREKRADDSPTGTFARSKASNKSLETFSEGSAERGVTLEAGKERLSLTPADAKKGKNQSPTPEEKLQPITPSKLQAAATPASSVFYRDANADLLKSNVEPMQLIEVIIHPRLSVPANP